MGLIMEKKAPKEGYKFCRKCGRKLKSTRSYFEVNVTSKDGLTNTCRECGRSGHFLPEDYVPRKKWSKEDNERFKELYPHYTNEELKELYYPTMTDHDLWTKASYMGVHKSEETMNRIHKIHGENMYGVDSPLYGQTKSDETKNKISLAKKGKYLGENNYWFGKKRSLDQRLNLSKTFKLKGKWKGKDNPKFKGNIKTLSSELHRHLRRNIKEWKIASMINCDYKCVITGERMDIIHHLYSFNNIVEDTLYNLNLSYKQYLYDYTDEEIKLIEEECLRLHMKSLGVCLTNEIHKLFHSIYGFGNNTPEQFEEFKINYLNNKLKGGEEN
jgi:hypothetical protein